MIRGPFDIVADALVVLLLAMLSTLWVRSQSYQDQLYFTDSGDSRYSLVSVAGTLLIHMETLDPPSQRTPQLSFNSLKVTEPNTRIVVVRYQWSHEPALPAWVHGGFGYHYEQGRAWGVAGRQGPSNNTYEDYKVIIPIWPSTLIICLLLRQWI